MSTSSIKCRKCRGFLAEADTLISTVTDKKGNQSCSKTDSTLYYIDWESPRTPEWLLETLTEAHFQRGKLICPHCKGRIGSFDFVSSDRCVCGRHDNSAVRLSRSRLDWCQISPIHVAQSTSSTKNAAHAAEQVPQVAMATTLGSQNVGTVDNSGSIIPLRDIPDGNVSSAQRWANAGPADPTLARRWPNDGSMVLLSGINPDVETVDKEGCSGDNTANCSGRNQRDVFQVSEHLSGRDRLLELGRNSVENSAQNSIPHELGQSSPVRSLTHISCNSLCTEKKRVSPENQADDLKETATADQLSESGHADGSGENDNWLSDGAASGSQPEEALRHERVQAAKKRRLSCRRLSSCSGSRFAPLMEDDQNPPAEEECQAVMDEVPPLAGLDADAYTCPVCLEIYYLPFTCHPCRHVFCGPCLRRLRGTVPIKTKCPLCREIICSCLPDLDLTHKVQAEFPEEYRSRRAAEKKAGRKLPPLPSTDKILPLSQLRRARSRGNNLILAHLAGVCFVTLLVILAMVVLISTVGMVLWYLWEVLMEVVVDCVLSANDFFDTAWTTFVSLLLEGHVSAQEAKILLGSFGQVLYAFGKLFNQTQEKLQSFRDSGFGISDTEGEESYFGSVKSAAFDHYIPKAVQTDIVNYLLIMSLVTYFIYRLASHILRRQQAERLEVQ